MRKWVSLVPVTNKLYMMQGSAAEPGAGACRGTEGGAAAGGCQGRCQAAAGLCQVASMHLAALSSHISISHMCRLCLLWAAAASAACVFFSALLPTAKQGRACHLRDSGRLHDDPLSSCPPALPAAPVHAVAEHVASHSATWRVTACRKASAVAMAQAKASAEHLARQAATAQQELCALRLQQQSGRLGQLALSRDGPLGQRCLCVLRCGRAALCHISAGS